MSLGGAIVGTLFVVSILLAIAQYRGYRPIEDGLARLRDRLGALRDRGDVATLTDGGDVEDVVEQDVDGADQSEIDRAVDRSRSRSRSRPDQSQVALGQLSETTQVDPGSRWIPEDPAPIRPISVEQPERSETIVVEVDAPDDVEIEVRRSGA